MAVAVGFGTKLEWQDVRNRFYQDMLGKTNDGTIFDKMRGMCQNAVLKKRRGSRFQPNDGDLILEDNNLTGDEDDVTVLSGIDNNNVDDDHKDRNNDQTDREQVGDDNAANRKRQRTGSRNNSTERRPCTIVG